MKTIQIEIRQQNETCKLHNLYICYTDDAGKPRATRLHSMALSLDEAKILALDIIIANPEYKPEIFIDTF